MEEVRGSRKNEGSRRNTEEQGREGKDEGEGANDSSH